MYFEKVYLCKLKTSCIHLLCYSHITKSIRIFGCGIRIFLILSNIKFKLILSHTHKRIVKSCSSYSKVCRIICQWIKYLTVGNSPCHHNIGRRMSFREHILYFLTGPDIPVRYTLFLHMLNPFICKSLTLSYTLHYLKGFTFIKSLFYKINHDIISGTDGCSYGCLTFKYQSLSISKPNIGTMCKSGNSYKI